jgi:hypothetical protein
MMLLLPLFVFLRIIFFDFLLFSDPSDKRKAKMGGKVSPDRSLARSSCSFLLT